MNDTTRRTTTPDTQLRNWKARQAQLAYRNLMRTITAQEQKELSDLRTKIHRLENDLRTQS